MHRFLELLNANCCHDSYRVHPVNQYRYSQRYLSFVGLHGLCRFKTKKISYGNLTVYFFFNLAFTSKWTRYLTAIALDGTPMDVTLNIFQVAIKVALNKDIENLSIVSLVDIPLNKLIDSFHFQLTDYSSPSLWKETNTQKKKQKKTQVPIAFKCWKIQANGAASKQNGDNWPSPVIVYWLGILSNDWCWFFNCYKRTS